MDEIEYLQYGGETLETDGFWRHGMVVCQFLRFLWVALFRYSQEHKKSPSGKLPEGLHPAYLALIKLFPTCTVSARYYLLEPGRSSDFRFVKAFKALILFTASSQTPDGAK